MTASLLLLLASAQAPTQVLTPVQAQPAPAIDTISVERLGDDLLISWTPQPGDVDGYQVLRSRDVTCSVPDIVHDGDDASRTYIDIGAFTDPDFAIYQVVAYFGADVGPSSEPIYRYRVAVNDIPMSIGDWVAFPFFSPHVDSAAMCTDANLGTTTVDVISRVDPTTGAFGSQSCLNPMGQFATVDGSAYLITSDGVGSFVTWGHGHPEQTFEFSVVSQSSPIGTGAYFISLPFDHAYADLRQIAAEIPEWVGVRLWNPLLPGFEGLVRSDVAMPWSGKNLSISDRRTEAVLIEVAAPTGWTPRRLCGIPCPEPLPRIEPLKLVRDVRTGANIELVWSPLLGADGGYSVFRVEQKSEIPAVLMLPEQHIGVIAADPVFPIVDFDAIFEPQDFYYQVAARCQNGNYGEL